MAHDNAARFKFRLLRDALLPDGEGNIRKRRKGEIVTGPHYKNLLDKGILVHVPPEPEPEPKPQAPAQETPPASDGTVTPTEEPTPTEPETAPEAPPEDPSPKVYTREELEGMGKEEVQALAGGKKGSKAKLIDHILKEQADA